MSRPKDRSRGDRRVNWGTRLWIVLSGVGLCVSAGLQVRAAQFPIADTAGTELSWSVARDGTNFLTAILGDDQGSGNITAQRFTGAGNKVGELIRVGRTGNVPGGLPTVVFGSTNYLVAWQDNGANGERTYAQRISRTGDIEGSSIAVASRSSAPLGFSPPGLAYGGGRFLVVWNDDRNGNYDVYGRMVSPDGTLGAEFAIAIGAQKQCEPSVAFDGTRFLVVWVHQTSNHPETWDVVGAQVGTDGAVGGAFKINQTSSPSFNPTCVEFDGVDFLAVWHRDKGGGSPDANEWDLHGRRVTTGGAVTGDELDIATESGSQAMPRMACGGGATLVVWSDGLLDGGAYTARGRFFDRAGRPLGEELEPFAAAGAGNAVLAGVGFDGTIFMAVGAIGEFNETTFEFTSGDVYGISLQAVAAPIILDPPLSRTNVVGSTATFAVSADGTAPLNFQWQHGGTNLVQGGRFAGVSSTHLTITGVQLADAGDYTVMVDNDYGSVTSAAVLTVTREGSDEDEIRALYADLEGYAAARDLEGFMSCFSADFMHRGSDYAALRESVQRSVSAVESLRFNIERIETVGDEATVYGSCTVALNNGEPMITWAEPNASDDGLALGWLRKTATGWRMVGNQERARVRVQTVGSTSGGGMLRLRTESAIEISSVTVTGPDIDATPLEPSALWDEFLQRVYVGADALPEVGTEYAFDVEFADETHQVLRDSVKSWVLVGPEISTTTESGILTIYWTDVSAQVPNAEYYWVRVSGEGVYWDSEDLPLSRSSIAFNEDGGATGSLQNGQSYLVSVYIFNGSGDCVEVSLLFTMEDGVGESPVISGQPQHQTVIAGQDAEFAVLATGTAPLNYQWYFNTSMPLVNATNSTLTISNVQATDEGEYSVVVGNDHGSVTSGGAVLTVIQPAAPVLGAPTLVEGLMEVSFTNHPGATFSVLMTTNVTLPLSEWTWVFNAEEVRAGRFRFQDTNTPVGSACYYAVVSPARPGVPFDPPAEGMLFVPAGSFVMGDTFDEGDSAELPTHAVYVSGFYMDQTEVTKALWEEVHTWALANGYSFDSAGSGKAANHTVHSISWYDTVKWCNARSEKEGKVPAYYTDVALSVPFRAGLAEPYVHWNRGYRLPTEAEWEKAARGGAEGRRFSWSDSDTIQHSRANYISSSTDAYDTSATRWYHPAFDDGGYPYTSPAGYFAPNGYGLYDMTGNVWEWCWDWIGWGWYGESGANQPDSRGPALGSNRVVRGGGLDLFAWSCRVASRGYYLPGYGYDCLGFRTVLPPGR